MIDKRLSGLHKFALATLLFLFFQFILGMTLNEFVTFPGTLGSTVPFDQFGTLLMQYPILLVHYALGLLLLAISIAFLVLINRIDQRDIRIRKRDMMVIGLLGFLSVFGALASGIAFMYYAFQNSTYSFAMAMGFIVALFSYFALFYKTRDWTAAPNRRKW